MADFFARLAERTLGVAPIVQPLVAPRFAPEPSAYPPLERPVGVPVSPGVSNETQDPLSRGATRAGNTTAGRPEDEAKTEPEIGSDLDRIGPDLPQESTDSRPRSHRTAEPDLTPSEADTSSSPGTSAPGSPPNKPRSSPSSYPVSPDTPSMTPENRRRSPSTAPRSRQTSDTRHELRPLAEPDPTESGDPTDVSRPAESVPVRTVLPPTGHLAERTSSSEIAPEPVARASSPGIETPSVTSAPTDRDRRAPQTVLSGVSIRPEGGLRERHPASFPEAQPPTIRVNIGRIEVRAVTPPPAPPRRQVELPARLSLDDYLKQRSGRGRR